MAQGFGPAGVPQLHREPGHYTVPTLFACLPIEVHRVRCTGMCTTEVENSKNVIHKLNNAFKILYFIIFEI